MADINSHNQACTGLLASIDALYNNKSVDFIHVYSYQGEKLLKSYALVNGEWNEETLPSHIISKERTAQIEDAAFVKQHVELGTEAAAMLSASPVKLAVQAVVEQLSRL